METESESNDELRKLLDVTKTRVVVLVGIRVHELI